MDPLQRSIQRVLARHAAVRLAVLFGSFARGDAHADSDIDIAVRGDVDVESLRAELSMELGREVDIVSLDTDDLILLAAIVRDGRPLREREPGTYARFRSHALATLETDLPSIRRQQAAFVARLARAGLDGVGS